MRRTPNSLSDVEAALVKAQMAAYARQMPLLYVTLGLSSLMLAALHWRETPALLALGAPAAFIVFACVRLFIWTRRTKLDMDIEMALRLRRTANILAPLVSVLFLLWALALFVHGTPDCRIHVLFFCGFAAVCSVFCQFHVRSAALAVTLVTIPPFALFLILQNDAVMSPLGVGAAMSGFVIVRMLFVHSRSFSELVALRVEAGRLAGETRRLALVDSLTGLPNRRSFFDRLEGRFAPHAPRRPFVIGVIDLDGFKPVNDLHGHSAGDRVLAEVGKRLSTLADDVVSFARLGGDEFGVFVDADLGPEKALALGQRICEAIAAPFRSRSAFVKIAASIGFAASREGGASAEKLYERADYALYHAKQRSRGRPVLFSAEHETAIRRQGLIEQALRTADLAKETSLLFQPVVDVEAGRTVAFEALARWRSPEIGPVSPAEFIPIAERTDLVNRLTRTLLAKALEIAKTWPEDVRVSFNLSARDLSPEAVIGIVALVRASGVAPGRIGFEITETAAMRDFEAAQAALATLRALGSTISLDDFGSGYSSLNSVRRLTLDAIKIDRGFIVDIETDRTAQDIVKTVIDLCRNLDLRCVVEGVESERQAAILRSLGCRTMQGYFYAKPLPPEEIAACLARGTDGAGRSVA